MTQEPRDAVVQPLQEANNPNAFWGLAFAPDALLFHPPTAAPPIRVPRQSLDRALRIQPGDPVSRMTVRLSSKVTLQLPPEVRAHLEAWLGADWRRVLAGTLKDEALWAMIFGAIWMGSALLGLLGMAANVPGAAEGLVFDLGFGALLLGVALLGVLVVRPLTLVFYPLAWLACGGWLAWGVIVGRTHWAWLLVLGSFLWSLVFSFKKYSWFERLAARFP